MMDEGSAQNIQNDFFNQARREKRRVAVFLSTGRRLTGRIRSFDRFTILLETAQGEQMVFKHAIATVGPVTAPASGRPREGFNNRMEIERGRRSGAKRAGESDEATAGDEPDSPDQGRGEDAAGS